jgi:uncharacterized protein
MALNARLDHRNPLVFDTHELGRRPGALQRLTRTVDAPMDLGIKGVIGVPEGAPVEVELRLESVMEGVLVTGTARATAEGECVRCLEPLEQELEAEFQEMFSYPDADDRGRVIAEPGDDAEDDEDRLFLEDGLFDLEPVLRDAVVLALPMQPVCREGTRRHHEGRREGRDERRRASVSTRRREAGEVAVAVPKRKMSRSNTRHRRSQWKAAVPTLVACERCHEPKQQHIACPSCGTYNKRQVLEV